MSERLPCSWRVSVQKIVPIWLFTSWKHKRVALGFARQGDSDQKPGLPWCRTGGCGEEEIWRKPLSRYSTMPLQACFAYYLRVLQVPSCWFIVFFFNLNCESLGQPPPLQKKLYPFRALEQKKTVLSERLGPTGDNMHASNSRRLPDEVDELPSASRLPHRTKDTNEHKVSYMIWYQITDLYIQAYSANILYLVRWKGGEGLYYLAIWKGATKDPPSKSAARGAPRNFWFLYWRNCPLRSK